MKEKVKVREPLFWEDVSEECNGEKEKERGLFLGGRVMLEKGMVHVT